MGVHARKEIGEALRCAGNLRKPRGSAPDCAPGSRAKAGCLRQPARESSRIRLSVARQRGIRARMAAHSEDYPGPPFGSREGNSLPAQLRGARIYSAAYWLRLGRLPCLVSRFGPAPGCRRGSDVEQGLIQIPDDVLDILDSYRQPDQSVGNANAFADLRWHGGGGHERGEKSASPLRPGFPQENIVSPGLEIVAPRPRSPGRRTTSRPAHAAAFGQSRVADASPDPGSTPSAPLGERRDAAPPQFRFGCAATCAPPAS